MIPILIRRGLYFFLLVVSGALILSGCGSGGSSSGPSSDVGALSFNVAYHGDNGNVQSQAANIDCAGEGIATVEASVYGQDNAFLQSGGPWNCDAGQGTIASVEAGSGRIVVVMGKNADGDVVFRGQKIGINVVAASDNNTGTIDCYAFVPTPLAPEDGATLETGITDLQWQKVTGTTEYRYHLIVSQNSDMSGPEINEFTSAATYRPLGLLIGQSYYWQVFTVDAYGNKGMGSKSRSVSVIAGPVNAAPLARITSPVQDSSFTINDVITFTGTGTDSEDGDLIGASLSWHSDIDGSIGEGLTLTSDTLTGGNHQITLTATDSQGATGTDRVAITVIEGSVPQGALKPELVVDGTEITVSWDPLADAAAYNIYWSTTSELSTTHYEGVFTVSDKTSFTHTLLTYGTAYRYALTAENQFGEGPISLMAVGVAGMDFDWYPVIAYARGYGVAVAKDENIYVSGEIHPAGVSGHPNGNLLYKQRPDGFRYWEQSIGLLHPTDPSSGGGNRIALDDRTTDQFCYITGHTMENVAVSGRDIFIEKYSAAGEKIWGRLINTPASDHAYDIAVYSNNSIGQYDTYITGFVSGGLGLDTFQGMTDVVVAKYDKDGTRLWARTMGTDQWDVAYGLDLDQYGHAYITGRTWGNLTGQGSGIFVAKYKFDGTLWWTTMVQAEGAATGYGNAITVDQYGNAYVTGYVGSSSSKNLLLAKYNQEGEELWVKIMDLPESINGMGITLDEQQSVYVAGYAFGSVSSMLNHGGADIFVGKFDAYGEPQWLRIFGGSGTDVAQRIAVSGAMAYIVGNTTGRLNGSSEQDTNIGDNAFLFELPLD